MAAPYFKMLWHEQLPCIHAGGVELRLVAGSLGDCSPPEPPPDSWAAELDSGLAIWTGRLAPGADWELPAGPAGVNRALYFFGPTGKGAVSVAGRRLDGPCKVRLQGDAP